MSFQALLPAASWQAVTGSAEETRGLAAALAPVAEPGDRLALLGPLGAGKTQFAKGFAAGLGISDVVSSPSFTLMAEYDGRLRLFHQDLYRLSGTAEALAGGLLDERQDEGVTLSEWADRLDDRLDAARLTVAIDMLDDDRRRIELRGRGDIASRYVAAARHWAAERG
jgi:tRNA threonylcarbamoyladenosine biosynthesis protein TsaE